MYKAKTLFVCESNNENLYLSSRNLSKSDVISVDELNTYAILNADKLLIEAEAVKKIEEILS